VVLPEAWLAQPERMREWIDRSLAWTAALPAKTGKAPSARRKGLSLTLAIWR